MVKRLAAAAAVAAVAAIVWVAFNIATSAEPDPEPSLRACISDGYIDCVSYDAPAAPIAVPLTSVNDSCKAWLVGETSIALLSRCLHAEARRREKTDEDKARRKRALAASS